MVKIIHLFRMAKRTYHYEGIKGVIKRVLFRLHLIPAYGITKVFKDVLFINGCALPHPARYRVVHQMQQLEFMGFSCDHVFYTDLTASKGKYYHTFVFYRCPITDQVKSLIESAHEQNKVCFFDIDDLVFDQQYTDQSKYVREMPSSDRDLYNDGVRRMRETLLLCDHAITTTERLATELKKIMSSVWINRNVASEDMVRLSEKVLRDEKECTNKVKTRNDSNAIVLGFFSGSITHNEDFEMIMPVITRIMHENINVKLMVVGELTLPNDLVPYRNRIIVKPFVDWDLLPALIRQADINLAPLVDTVFNEAKSENKWVEAALVRVPTVASDIGAFSICVEPGITGFLCREPKDWYDVLTELINNPDLRRDVADAAWKIVHERHISAYTSSGIASIIRHKKHQSIGFVMPSTKVSGGINVIVKHAHIMKRQGYRVILISEDIHEDNLVTSDGELEVISNRSTALHAYFDIMVATLWSTVAEVVTYAKALRKCYLVQGFETDFHEYGSPFRVYANLTYCYYPNITYLTISKWCQKWLNERFDVPAEFAPNGLDTNRFYAAERDFTGRIRVLVEGNSDDPIKNVDESFRIVNSLDPRRYEIWYLSNAGKPKDWYRIDQFFHQIQYDLVADIYRQCHILLKSSKLESFSYPPLEMMATGGYVVVAPNDGNLEYLVDEKNCLMYQGGDIEGARRQIERIVADKMLRERLYINGRNVADSRNWDTLTEQISQLYLGEMRRHG